MPTGCNYPKSTLLFTVKFEQLKQDTGIKVCAGELDLGNKTGNLMGCAETVLQHQDCNDIFFFSQTLGKCKCEKRNWEGNCTTETDERFNQYIANKGIGSQVQLQKNMI